MEREGVRHPLYTLYDIECYVVIHITNTLLEKINLNKLVL